MIEEQKKLDAAAANEKIKHISAEISELAEVLHYKGELRDVEVTERKDYTQGVVRTLRVDTQEYVALRPMEPSEMQVEIPLKVQVEEETDQDVF